MTTRLLKGLTGAFGAAAFTVMIAGAAQAQEGVIAEAILNVTNFQLEDGAGNVYTIDELSYQSGGNSGDVSANLDSVAGSETDSATAVPITSPGFGQIDLDNVCQGDCPAVADNTFTPINSTAAPNPTGHFAQADQELTGVGLDTGGAAPLGADAMTAARSSLTTNDSGTALANTGTETTLQFTATEDGVLEITLNWSLFLMAYVDAETSDFLSSATARSSWNITIVEDNTGTTLLSTSPDELNTNVSRNDANAQLNELAFINESGSFSFGPVPLVGGFLYTVTVTHEVFVDTALTQIPEPTTAALFGAGLLGLAFFGFAYRRRSRLGM